MLFKEITAVYIEKHTEAINTKCRLLIAEGVGTYSYHSALKDSKARN
jgi:hypothetical protein